jgi:4-alpha-glucanotransferase
LLINLDYLIQSGWLDESTINSKSFSREERLLALHDAWEGFNQQADEQQHELLDAFVQEQAYWLNDYALFRAIRKDQDCSVWWEWPEELRDRSEGALAEIKLRLSQEIDYVHFEQFIFFQQWSDMKRYANQRGVELFGDMPIFIAHDSAEVWANQLDFLLNEHGMPTVVAGVPPDYFSETGQRWGNPLYDWDHLQKSDFSFWIQRIKTQLSMYDLIRIDHFRGFESYWEIAAEEETAINGRWVSAPGGALFERLYREYKGLPLVAEDLGIITPEVEYLRDNFALPGMKVLQFAFSGDAENPHLPFKYPRNSVVYAGTHDNDTTVGWYESLDQHTKSNVDDFLGNSSLDMPWPMIWEVLASSSDLAVLMMQDLLELGGEHRMNTPGTTEDNWEWRFTWDQVDSDLASKLRYRNTMYGRLAQ